MLKLAIYDIVIALTLAGCLRSLLGTLGRGTCNFELEGQVTHIKALCDLFFVVVETSCIYRKLHYLLIRRFVHYIQGGA